MRTRIKDYKVTIANAVASVHIALPEGVEYSAAVVQESVRLIIDETAHVVFCSSMQKDAILSIEPSAQTGYDVAISFAIPTGKTVAATDRFTIELDWGTTAEELASLIGYTIQEIDGV